jgi:ABC-2 type transport system ATP-binding protein
MNTPAIELFELTKTYRVTRRRTGSLWARARDLFAPEYERVTAVDRISFAIGRGERVAFIGPNGAGKSTTLKMLSGILHPDSGDARVLGRVPWREQKRLAFEIGTVFGQRSQLWYHLPARDTFELLARVYELDEQHKRTRLAALIELFAFGALLDKPVSQLSLGERMRAELLASLLHSPSILFLDEPTIGLDVSAKAAIRALLRECSEQDGATLLLTSHDTGDMERVCDRVIVINHGRVLWDGPLSELRRTVLESKRITLLSECEHLTFDLHGVRVLSQQPYRSELELAAGTTPVGAVVDAALRQGGLRDLTVEDPPFDEVIQRFYAQSEARLPP